MSVFLVISEIVAITVLVLSAGWFFEWLLRDWWRGGREQIKNSHSMEGRGDTDADRA